MPTERKTVAAGAEQLAAILGVPGCGVQFAVRSALNTKIVEEVARRSITHVKLETMAHTSRTRITAILNRNTQNVSTDLMLRVLGALHITTRIVFGRAQ